MAVTSAPPSYISSVIARRDYIRVAAGAKLQSAHVGSLLGNIWHLLNPVLSIAVYYVVFGLVIESSRGTVNFFSFLTVGALCFDWMRKSVATGATSISGNEQLIRTLQFPRMILPLTAVYEEIMLFLPTLAISIFVGTLTVDNTWSLQMLLFPIIFVLQIGFITGMSLITARLGDLADDIHRLLPFVMRLVFYMSGVIYSVEGFIANSFLRMLFLFNPFYVFVELHRVALLGYDFRGELLLAGAAWSIVALAIGYPMFRRAEHTFGRPDR